MEGWREGGHSSGIDGKGREEQEPAGTLEIRKRFGHQRCVSAYIGVLSARVSQRNLSYP